MAISCSARMEISSFVVAVVVVVVVVVNVDFETASSTTENQHYLSSLSEKILNQPFTSSSQIYFIAF